ncbi:MAG TPA: potassium transporter TrkA [Acidimicrobiia bacterium]|nr:potassium transporter TrkA [Acidimicrobiia bacterium]
MGDVHVEELFGIGKRYDIRCSRGQRVSIIVHKDGVRELYVFETDDEDPTATVRLEESEARKIGAVLGGTYFTES